MGCLSLGKLVFLWGFPAVLILMFLINLGTDVKYMQRSLDHLNAVRNLDRDKIPVVSTETVFITTTILVPSPSTAIEADDATNRMATTLSASIVSVISTTSPDPTPSTSNSRTDDRSQTDTTMFPSIPTPSPSPSLNENSLIPIPAFPIEWSNIRIDFPPAARETLDKVLGGLSLVWEVFRKAYHYPLDPP